MSPGVDLHVANVPEDVPRIESNFLRAYQRARVPHYWIVDPRDQTLTVHRWTPEGYLVVLKAERGERTRAEPFEAIELQVGIFFGDEDDAPSAE